MSDMDFTRIKNLIRGNGERLILVENGEPEAVVMSFDEYTRLTGTGAVNVNRVNAASTSIASKPTHPPAMPRQTAHAVDEQLDMPLYSAREYHDEPEFYGEPEPVFDEAPKPLAHDMSVRLADIRLEDLPI